MIKRRCFLLVNRVPPGFQGAIESGLGDFTGSKGSGEGYDDS
jgi:hypothetical protein